MELRTLEIHYGGFFKGDPISEYYGGKISYADNVDPDLMSIIELWDMLQGLGLPKESMIYYTMPIGDISNGLKLVEGDKAVLDMLKCHDEFGVILLYIVSLEMVDEEALNELTEDVDIQGEQLKNNNTENEVQKDADGQGKKDEGMGEAPNRNVSEVVEENNEDAEKDAEAGSESDSEHEWSNFGDSDEDSINDSDFCINVNNVEEEDINDGIGQGGPTTSRPAQAEANDKGTKTAEDNDQSSDYQPSDDLDSMSSSDEDGPSRPKYPVFNKSRDWERAELKLGMKFASAAEFRTLLRNNAISSGYDFYFVKNDGDRVTVKCKKDSLGQKISCGWRVHASWNAYEECFQIKSLQSEHKCGRQFKNNQATSSWIANKYLDQLRDNPTWGTSAMKKTMRRDLCIDVSKSQIYRAKRKAKEVIMGSNREQFMKLWDYCNIIRLRNPGSLAFLHVERPHPELAPVFQRIFVSYDAQIKGLKQGCRPIIGIDGCFLKGSFGGQLISAIGRDGNNQMFPIAVAVVEAELKDSWNWFFNKFATSYWTSRGTWVDFHI
uniref:Transposase MuDR plant domain-containing protein n=1 Tax=Ananas comosus var. bracteatus TaxID=296719 RepID=A0A6V7PHY2_ANACO|nr:unnamed protein product [Ananas comosus var. bracteatus]